MSFPNRFSQVLFRFVLALTVPTLFGGATSEPGRRTHTTENTRGLAEQGHAGAEFTLGVSYLYGYGVPRDVAEGLKWLRKAAAQGHAKARDLLQKLEQGKGLAKQLTQSYRIESGHVKRPGVAQ